MRRLIDSLPLPAGLRGRSVDDLAQVAHELRQELIDSVASSGGHFASSLGTCELSVALHAAFDTPNDKLVWDVGHQAYIHKMLTGRREQMNSIRQKGGVSGFLKRSESPYDSFGAGHAGTSVSAAVGMSLASQRAENPYYVVPIIGDGSITAGMAFEALNHAGALGLKKFIVVINDNEMSISPNVGALSWLFSKAVTSHASNVVRNRFKNLHRAGYVPDLVYKVLDRAEDLTQGFFAGPALLFESFGFRYIGPVDGHNVGDLMKAFEHAKEQEVPVVIHTYTTKGKGYSPAEADPLTWHGVTPFDAQRGEFLPGKAAKLPPSYTQVFADTLIELAKNDSRIMAFTAAMPSGTGLDKFGAAFPDRCFDVGICEQHAVTAAAGLACEGYRPVVAIYSTFLQRAFDQVVHDVAVQNLPVVFAADRGGVVGNDGETHQGVFDIAYLRSIPHMVIMSPKDEGELRHMLHTSLQLQQPTLLRYPRGNGIGADLSVPLQTLDIGKAEVLRSAPLALNSTPTVALVALGPVVQFAMKAADRLQQEHGIAATVINARFAKPLDTELFAQLLPRHAVCISIEDHSLMGGFGSALLECLADRHITLQQPLIRLGVKDSFIAHASQAEQYAQNGYDVDSIVKSVVSAVSDLRPAAQVAVG